VVEACRDQGSFRMLWETLKTSTKPSSQLLLEFPISILEYSTFFSFERTIFLRISYNNCYTVVLCFFPQLAELEILLAFWCLRQDSSHDFSSFKQSNPSVTINLYVPIQFFFNSLSFFLLLHNMPHSCLILHSSANSFPSHIFPWK
jgi:hypothetical protein